MKAYHQLTTALALAILLILAGDGCAQRSTPPSKASISVPCPLNDGWVPGNLSGADIDSTRLVNLLRRVDEKEYSGIDGILIVRNNRLVFEEYFPGNDFEYTAKDFKGRLIDYDCTTIHNLASVTKSITALLFGIAIDKGFVRGVDEKLYSFFPADSSLFDGDKKKITLAHLLTMSSGLKWNEQDISYGNMSNDIVQLFIVPDPVRYILSKPLANRPGTTWYYNGGGTNLIGQILQRTSGVRLDTFAQKYLFDPLGIKNLKWVYINDRFVDASGDLRLSPRSMAKLGSLVLNKGEWNGTKVISPQWIEEMTRKRVWLPKDDGYGYQWWLQTYKLGSRAVDSYHAGGWGGQWIIVLPELNAVVVLTGNNYVRPDVTNDIMCNYVLPSMVKDFSYDFNKIQTEAPLPDNISFVASGGNSPFDCLSGRWCGQWDAHFLSCQLVVERISAREATVVYSWADHPAGYFKKGWVRKSAGVDSTGTIRFETSDSLSFRYDPKEDVLIGNLKNQYVTSKAILRRIKM